ncbi:flagellar protein FlbA [Borrelia hermsii]|uniref:Flagellar protein FlbA n=3 Tax=Borrelia hermsii TaxID=140 RepID=A0AAN0X5M9_BORHE|nr:flagellar protein FlbA [Borrelia hermsii]AAX16804.1 flagellar protein [Borrelia hermsii DAH]AJW73104.1 flagellar protein FlbA [Borrelia hermsii CC1]AMR75542.1 flagellar protein FlbA [Borrelia hermsii]ANA43103.1 flagellar protein FlbA [Borrelia hermsii HS1]UCP01313.1 flagellar protein FlbA [Borrelia hermsii]
MNDLIFKKKKFEKIMSVRTYDRKSSENDLMNINNEISKIEEFLKGNSKTLNKLNNTNIFLKGNYLDYLTCRKEKELKKLAKLKHEYNKYHDIYLKKYVVEKKVDILIKTLNNTIIKENVKSESLVLDEYVNYKICKKLGTNNE